MNIKYSYKVLRILKRFSTIQNLKLPELTYAHNIEDCPGIAELFVCLLYGVLVLHFPKRHAISNRTLIFFQMYCFRIYSSYLLRRLIPTENSETMWMTLFFCSHRSLCFVKSVWRQQNIWCILIFMRSFIKYHSDVYCSR